MLQESYKWRQKPPTVLFAMQAPIKLVLVFLIAATAQLGRTRQDQEWLMKETALFAEQVHFSQHNRQLVKLTASICALPEPIRPKWACRLQNRALNAG